MRHDLNRPVRSAQTSFAGRTICEEDRRRLRRIVSNAARGPQEVRCDYGLSKGLGPNASSWRILTASLMGRSVPDFQVARTSMR